jgi:hypothetical protein
MLPSPAASSCRAFGRPADLALERSPEPAAFNPARPPPWARCPVCQRTLRLPAPIIHIIPCIYGNANVKRDVLRLFLRKRLQAVLALRVIPHRPPRRSRWGGTPSSHDSISGENSGLDGIPPWIPDSSQEGKPQAKKTFTMNDEIKIRIRIKKREAWNWYPRPELNRDGRFRKPLLYPFEVQGHRRIPMHQPMIASKAFHHGFRG